jgi:hypothetical protein
MRTLKIQGNVIETFQRLHINDWVARLRDNWRYWESGATEAEAIGKLIITLSEEL